MASTLNVAVCALAAAAFWTLLGVALGRLVLADRALVLPLAPAVGWAAFNAAALPVFLLAGLTRTSVAAVVLISAAMATAVVVRSRLPLPAGTPRLPLLACLGAVALALIPAAAVLPKIGNGGALLAVPIFDHSKLALIDAMVRLGLPAINPVFAEVGGPDGVFYYYLWHFSAATAALATGASGWEADAALTWFTAWSSLMLMMGLAVWLSGRAAAAFWALALAAVGSLRPALEWLFGFDTIDVLLRPAAGLAGWLFQASWSPQHVQAACCAVLAVLLVAELPRRRGMAVPAVLALILAAGFQSSLWVGGLVVPVAGATAMFVVLRDQSWSIPRRCAAAFVAAALGAAALSAPLIIEQYQASLLRGVSSPLAIAPLEVLGTLFPSEIRRILDLPAFWTVFLVVTFPAAWPLGALVLIHFIRLGTAPPVAGAVAALAALAATSLLASWLMVSTIGDNNDLGWRAVLPGLLILSAFAAAGLADAPFRLPRAARIAAVVLILIGLPHTIAIARHNLLGSPSDEAPVLARSVELWQAVRRHAAPADRIANNPLFLQATTLWPANISWALLADRSSCYAGRELALAFASLSAERRQEIDAQFVRVFMGDAAPDDIHDIARRYDCRVAVVTPQDGAWQRDPFAASPLYRLVEDEAGRWRIYVRQEEGGATSADRGGARQ